MLVDAVYVESCLPRATADGRLGEHEAARRSCPLLCAIAGGIRTYQLSLPGSPLKGPTRSGMTQPP